MKTLSTRIVSLSLCLASVNALPATYLVGEKEEHCFFQSAERSTQFKAKVFVFQGGLLDIGFSVRGPVPLDSEGNPTLGRRKVDLTHEAKVVSEVPDDDDDGGDDSYEEFSGYEYQFYAVEGHYEICLFNDRRFTQDAKHVLLDISEVVEDEAKAKETTGDHKADSKVADDSHRQKGLGIIAKGVGELESVFSRIESVQLLERMRLTKRKMAAEGNRGSMVQSSVLETVVLLVVGFGQIFFVRRWFQGKGTLLKQWA